MPPRYTLALLGACLGVAPATAAAERSRSPDLERVHTITDGALSGKAVFSPTEMHFAALTTDGAVRLVQPSGTVLRSFKAHAAQITAVDYSPNGRYLLAGTDKGDLHVWDLRTGERRNLSVHPMRSIGYVGWLSGPDRCVVAAGLPENSSSNAVVLDLASGKAVWQFSAIVRDGFATLCQARDGTRVIALGVPEAKGSACLLHGTDGHIESRLSLPEYPGGWLAVCVSPDGKTLATGQARDIVLWDLSTGRSSGTLKGHESWVVALAFSPDGRYLASGSRDGTARLWDVGRTAEAGAIRFESGARVMSVSFSPDGALLLASTWADHILARVPAITATMPAQASSSAEPLISSSPAGASSRHEIQ